MNKRKLLFWMIFIMVAELGLSTDPSTSKSTSSSAEMTHTISMNIGKAFAHCVKLDKTNYFVWLTGLLTTIAGITGVAHLKCVHELISEWENGKQDMEQIEREKMAQYRLTFSDSEDQAKTRFTMVNQLLYTIISSTINNEKMSSIINTVSQKQYRGNGLKYLHLLFNKVGPGGTTMQLTKKLKIQDEKQTKEETGEEFAERLISANDELHEPIGDTMLAQIYLRGLHDPDLKKYMLQEMLAQRATTLETMKEKCVEYELQSNVLTHGLDGLMADTRAPFAFRGARGGRGRGAFGGRGRGRGRDGNCSFCGLPNHFWRACRFLNRARRLPGTTAEQHRQLDQRRDQLLNAATPEFRQQIQSFLEEQASNGNNNQVNAQLAQPVNAQLAEAQQQAALEFPVDGRLADVVVGQASVERKNTGSTATPMVNMLWKILYVALAMMLSTSGALVFFAVLSQQVGGASATATNSITNENSFSLREIDIPQYIQVQKSSINNDKSATAYVAAYNVSAGVAWDTCAGICMFNTPEPFYKWDTNPIQYKINGATASDYSQGSGQALVGFSENGKEQDAEWYDVQGAYVKGLSESLMAATWFALWRGVITQVSNAPFLMTQQGQCIPLSIANNVTRCKHIHFWKHDGRPLPMHIHSKPPVVLEASQQPSLSQVDGRAAMVVDSSRNVTAGNEKDEVSFAKWTKALCGLSPRAVAHLHEATNGCDCTARVPHKYKDLRWWASAVASKSKHSPHPPKERETTRFRENVAMDFLEFEINGKKFHAHAFVDYHTTVAYVKVTQNRTAVKSASNLLWFLNQTEAYVTGSTLVRLVHDRAKEFMARYFKNVAVYSMVVTFALVPYEHQQNAIVERFNQTLQRMVTAVLHDANFPEKYIIYVIEFCNFVYNVVPVEALGWKTRWECMTGEKPNLRYLFRCGCKARVLLPLELRKHKFDTYTEDCVYLGPCPEGRGTRFIRLKNMTVYVRQDCVVYPEIMPFRSMGGQGCTVPLSGTGTSAAQDRMIHMAAWDDEDPPVGAHESPEQHNQQASPNFSPGSPGSTVVADNNRSGPWSPAPMQRLDTDLVSPDTQTMSPEAYIPYVHAATPDTQPNSKTQRPSENPTHGTLSTTDKRGEWKANHCELSSDCELPNGHDGLCSHIPPHTAFRGTRGARAGIAARVQLPSVQEEGEDDHDVGNNETDAENELDALLATASVTQEAMNKTGPTQIPYVTAINALVATVDSELLDGPVIDKQSRKRTLGEFDLSLPIPNNLAEARQSPNWDVPFGWKYAYEVEGGAFIKHGVMTDAETVPADCTVIPMGEILTVKCDKHGRFKKAKLRFVCKAHQRIAKQGEHFFDNFSQTCKWSNLRSCVDYACLKGFTEAYSWDTSTAFLYQVLEPGTRVYIKLPPGLGEFCGVKTSFAKVVKNVYGLPSAPSGFEKFRTEALLSDRCKMKQCKHDEAVFCRFEGDKYILICTWVDDFLVLSNDRALYEEVYKGYFSEIDGDENPLDFMLGVNFDVDVQNQTIKIYSEKAIKRTLQRFGEPLRVSAVPCLTEYANLHEEPLPEPNSPEWVALRPAAERYRSLVPSMLYVGTTTRPDIVHTLSLCCRCLDNPSKRHIECADNLLAYLAGTVPMGILYSKKQMSNNRFRVLYSGLKNQGFACSDSNWAPGKSTSGFAVYGACGIVAWGAKLQAVTALSSTEAEYYAASVCGVEVLAFRNFLTDIDQKPLLPTPLFIDNSACVNLGKHFASCKRAKHIDRRVYFLTDYQEQGHLELLSVPTTDNTADVFTKPLIKQQFLKHRAELVV